MLYHFTAHVKGWKREHERLARVDLIANFLFNALALYGLSRLMVAGEGVGLLVVGIMGTLGCLAVLSQPYRREHGP